MKHLKYAIAITSLFTWLVSCDDKMAEMNTDPLALSELPDDYLFTTAIRGTFGHIPSTQMRFGSQYAHIYATNSENRAADSYQDFHTQDIYKEMFERIYLGPLRYANEVIQMTASGKYQNPVRNALANIVAVVNYAQVADWWGDIPYSEGALGSSVSLYPKYDKQEDIYPDMINRLKLAMAILESASPDNAYPGADPVYGNDLTKWVRFANSFRLRLAMRIRFADPAFSATVIAGCMEKPLIEFNGQNFELTHQESDNGELYNPWYDLRKVQNWKMSEKFTEWLKSTGDPRLNVFVEPNANGEFIGVPNGLNEQAFSMISWKDRSNPMPVLYAKSLSQYIMCASEVWFLRAEAALFNLADGDPNELYRQGISSNFELWKVNTSLAEDFLNNQSEATLSGSAENRFRQICSQAWIAFIPNFTEAWTNIRRTGYPEISRRTNTDVFSLGVTNGILPTRFRYVSSEYLNNHDHVTEAVSQMGPDKIDTPLWWDAKGN